MHSHWGQYLSIQPLQSNDDDGSGILIEELQGGIPLPLEPPGYRPPTAPAVGTPGAPMPTAIVEPTGGDWTSAGSMGRSVVAPFPSTEGGVLTVFNRDRLYGPPRQRLLHLFRDNLGQTGLGQNSDVYAHVTYGVGGAQNEFFCDWRGHVPLICDSVRVDAVTYRPLETSPYVSSQNLNHTLGALLGNAGASPAQAPTLTTGFQSLGNVAPNNTRRFAVPDFARRVVLNLNVFGLVPVATDFKLILDTANFQGVSMDFNLQMITEGIVLPGWCQGVLVVNTSANGATAVGLTWVLGL